jgi:UDP-N-acetylmuramate--alanine ligase
MDGIKRLIQGRAPVHMTGIGGIGMAGVALLLRARGVPVCGCDAQAGGAVVEALQAAGIDVASGHSAAHVAGCEWLIRTPAVAGDSEEIMAARSAGIPVWRRGEVLAALVNMAEVCSAAVAGTHGKTTTTTLIAQLLLASETDPSWCIGGQSPVLGAVAHAGKGGALVVEADESDGTLALYRPAIAVVNNIEFDHMEHFESVDAFESCFGVFMQAASQRVFYGCDDPRACRLGKALPNGIGFGFGPDADLRGDLADDGRQMRIFRDGQALGALPLVLPGRHNALNLLAAAGVCLELGIPMETLAAGAAGLVLPQRRFETICQANGVRVISDYAHHPSEIAALVQTARRDHPGRLVAVFQPHRYTRTAALGADFPAAFAGVDELVLVPVYAASEPMQSGGMACDLYAHFRDQSNDGRRVPVPLLATSLKQAWGYLRQHLQPGDWLLVVGAGDVEQIAGWARAEGAWLGHVPRLSGDFPSLPASVVRFDEPMSSHTTYRVGGATDVWVEMGDAADLATVLRHARQAGLPLQVLGAGSNILVTDLGVRGVVMRLAGRIFQQIDMSEAPVVTAGGAVPLAKLQESLTVEGLTGLEFIEGVPGSVGGIVRMNGGAYGHEVRERILWIRGLKRDGESCIVPTDALEWGYRGCESLREMIVVEAAFRLDKGAPEAIRERRREIAEKRAWMRGLRCAGSVFRNPPGGYAGRLVEETGLKGMRIGGAGVPLRHGNFVVAEKDATASDVLALIQRIEQRVRQATGVSLVREVIFLE